MEEVLSGLKPLANIHKLLITTLAIAAATSAALNFIDNSGAKHK